MQSITMIMIYYWDRKLKMFACPGGLYNYNKKIDVMSLNQGMHFLYDVFQMTTVVLASVMNHYHINGLHQQGPDNIFRELWKKHFKVVTGAKNFWDCKYVVEEWKSTTSVIIFFSLALIILVFCDFCENLRDTIFRTWQKILFY